MSVEPSRLIWWSLGVVFGAAAHANAWPLLALALIICVVARKIEGERDRGEW